MNRTTGQKTGRSVLITGAGRGLGRRLTTLFLEQGYTVFAGTRREAGDFSGPSGSEKPDLHYVRLDVTDAESVERAVQTIGALCAGLDVLINNAAICESEGSTIEGVDFEKVAEMLDVNTLGPLRVTKAFLPLLRRGMMKTIVNVSSEAGSIENCRRKGMFGYCMSKAALNMQSKLLHNYLAGDGFRVLSIHPGWMRTDMGGKNADIDPKEAAGGIFDIVKNRDKAKSLYIDYKGIPLRY
jgi:NAD(P)-dependent dehydrogenase (short-subunit alcohol dehydrogenase family)